MVANRGKPDVLLIDAFGPVVDISRIQPFDNIHDQEVRFWRADKLAEVLNEHEIDTDETNWDDQRVYERFACTLNNDSIWTVTVSVVQIAAIREQIESGVEVIVFSTVRSDVFGLVRSRLQQDIPRLLCKPLSGDDLMKECGTKWAKERKTVWMVDDEPIEEYSNEARAHIKHYIQTQPEFKKLREYSSHGVSVRQVPVSTWVNEISINVSVEPPPQTGKSTRSVFLWVLALVTLLVGGGGLITFFACTENSGYLIGEVRRPPGTRKELVVVVTLDGRKDSEVQVRFQPDERDGTYKFPEVKHGPHNITFTANGYKTAPIKHTLRHFFGRYCNMEVKWPKEKKWVSIY